MAVKSTQKIAIAISIIAIVCNVLLAAIKFFAGFFSKSYALISDGIDSSADILTTVILIIGIKIASKPYDEKHPFGHDRFECVVEILLAFFLVIVGGKMGLVGIESLIDKSYLQTQNTHLGFALVVAIISIVMKESMYWFTIIGAKKINSGALKANAWNFRVDAISSIGSVIAIIGLKFGLPILDPIISIIICLFVLRTGITIFVKAISKMTDEAMDDSSIEKIRVIVLNDEGVRGIDSLKTRKFGDRNYVELEIEVDCNLTIYDAHEIAERVHDKIEQDVEYVKHCVVHVNPSIKTDCQE